MTHIDFHTVAWLRWALCLPLTFAFAVSATASTGRATAPGALGGGYGHTCAVTDGGTVKCWGYNLVGQLGNGSIQDSTTPVTVSGITDAIAVTAGYMHSCALRATGGVLCWGYNGYGELGAGIFESQRNTPVAVAGIQNAIAISAGTLHTCALLAGGTVQCWGGNDDGQLGVGNNNQSNAPLLVNTFANVVAVSAGDAHTCAASASGAVQCWGRNGNGQLGNGTLASTNLPANVGGLSSVTHIAAGGSHTCARLGDGTLRCWGANYFGQLGNGTMGSDQPLPTAVPGINDAVNIVAGTVHSCALRQDATLRCWGNNGWSQLGHPDFDPAPVPLPVPLVNVANFTLGFGHTCATLADASLRCWGSNEDGQLGNGATGYSAVPVPVQNIATATALAAGTYASCAVQFNGSVRCWGYNADGELGDGSLLPSATPVTVLGLNNATNVTMGLFHVCALTSTGTVYCWGNNDWGQLGNGSFIGSPFPVAVSGISGATALSADDYGTCVLSADGSVKCWGGSSDGDLGNGSNSSSPTPVTVSGITGASALISGGGHHCVITDNGGAKCWGNNSAGQLGNRDTVNHSTPVDVIGVTGVTALSAGNEFTCLNGSSGVQCWGQNIEGQLGTGDWTSSLIPMMVPGLEAASVLASSWNSSCAIRSGTVMCWGANGYGQLGNGTRWDAPLPMPVPGLFSATAVAEGSSHTCALLGDGSVHCWGNDRYGELGNGVFGFVALPGIVTGSPFVTHALTYAAGSHGTLAGATTQVVDHNTSGSAVSAVPDAGYHFAQWSDASTQNPRTDANVQADVAVTASFVVNVSLPTVTLNPPASPLEDAIVPLNATATVDGGESIALVEADCAYDGTTFGADVSAASAAGLTCPAYPSGGARTIALRATSGHGDTSAIATSTINVVPVNDAPTLVVPNLIENAGGSSGAISVPSFAICDAGPPDEEATQAAAAYLIDSIDDPSGILANGTLSIALNGTLHYTLTGNSGTAVVHARVRDNGGTANGGQDTSATVQFSIHVLDRVDVTVAIDDHRSGVYPDQVLVYAILVGNPGPASVNGAILSDSLPATLSNATWRCVQANSTATCPQPLTGSGDLNVGVQLGVGQTLLYELTASVHGNVGDTVYNRATVTPPPGTTPINTTDDTAVDADTILSELIFANGFEVPMQ